MPWTYIICFYNFEVHVQSKNYQLLTTFYMPQENEWTTYHYEYLITYRYFLTYAFLVDKISDSKITAVLIRVCTKVCGILSNWKITKLVLLVLMNIMLFESDFEYRKTLKKIVYYLDQSLSLAVLSCARHSLLLNQSVGKLQGTSYLPTQRQF